MSADVLARVGKARMGGEQRSQQGASGPGQGLRVERRQGERRVREEPALVASSNVFGREERGVLRSLERRRQLRRRKDLFRNLARLQELAGET